MAQQQLPGGLGAKLSPPDHRDWHIYGAFTHLTAPQNNDLREYKGGSLATPVRSQDDTSSCTAFAGTAVRAALAAKYHLDLGERPDLGDTLSERFLYYWTRHIDGDFPQDAGATMRAACQALTDHGVAPERFMPWNASQLNADPPPDATAAAGDYGISGYLRLAGSGQTLLGSILQNLADGYPAYVAINVYQSFVDTGADGRVKPRRAGDTYLGGHALPIFASFADQSAAGGGWLLAQNSWGVQYGEQGWYYLPWQYVLDGTLAEAWSVR